MQFVHLNKYMFKQHFERVRKITNDGIKYKKNVLQLWMFMSSLHE